MKNKWTDRPVSKPLDAQAGLAAMEFTVLLPLLLLLSMGVVDFGRLMYAQEMLANASREGARQGILLTTPRITLSEIQTVVQNTLMQQGYNPSVASVEANGAGGSSGADLEVKVNYPFDFWVVSKLVPGMMDSMTLSSTTVMKME
ncbi:MAG: pilus assembly protein [Nitrospirales bacterium]|nr:pilus assembly protein [Nitrospira sp.]MDR4501778.1 pilus assembly protein [Nitrospirales bacterium]